MPFRLLLRSLLGHPVRAALTVASVAVAVFLLCFLHAGIAGLTRTIAAAAQNRLFVQSAVSLFVDLPLAYQGKIAQVPGIEAVCRWQWFGGEFAQDKSGFFAQFGIDPASFLPSYPEITIVDGSYETFTQQRSACVIGKDLQAKYGWQVGQTVPITGKIFPRTDGRPWEFTVAAIYESSKPSIDQNTLYFHFDYLRESLEAGAALGDPAVGVYMLRLAKDGNAEQVMADVDALFANGPQRVRTATEAEFSRQFISMLGDIPSLLRLIGAGVLFAIFFAVLNTMLMAARERTRDLGVLKALGFGNGTCAALLIAESLLLCGAGALLGVLVTRLLDAPFQRAMASFLPGFAFDFATLMFGVAIALGIGLVAGLVPGWRAAQLRPIAALREVG